MSNVTSLYSAKPRLGIPTLPTITENTPRSPMTTSPRPRGSQSRGPFMAQQARIFQTLALSDCKNIHDYAAQLRRVYDNMNNLDKDVHISEHFLVMRFLRDLGQDYDSFKAFFEVEYCICPERNSDETIRRKAVTYLEAVEAAKRFELRLSLGSGSPKLQPRKDSKMEKVEELLGRVRSTSRPQVKRKRDTSGIWCSHCEKMGSHDMDNCWMLYPRLKEIWLMRQCEELD